jgi:hypothetical protein
LKLPVRITTVQLKAACREAYRTKRLTAQHPEGLYRYRQAINGRNCGCAIGVTLPPEALDKIEADGLLNFPLATPIMRLLVEFEDEDEAVKIQRAHDRWLDARRYERCRDEIAEREADFCRAIGLKVQVAELAHA